MPASMQGPNSELIRAAGAVFRFLFFVARFLYVFFFRLGINVKDNLTKFWVDFDSDRSSEFYVLFLGFIVNIYLYFSVEKKILKLVWGKSYLAISASNFP